MVSVEDLRYISPSDDSVELIWNIPTPSDYAYAEVTYTGGVAHEQSGVRIDSPDNRVRFNGMDQDATYTFSVTAYDTEGRPALPVPIIVDIRIPDTVVPDSNDNTQMGDSDGDGLIEIETLEQLDNIRHNLAGTSYKEGPDAIANSEGCPVEGCFGYELMDDIDAASIANFDPIGTSATPFSGTFDGDDWEISNLTISGAFDAGLFGVASGTIRNLTLRNVRIAESTANGFVGMLVARLTDAGSATNIGVVDGSIDYSNVPESRSVGGLVGENRGSVRNSYTSSTIPQAHIVIDPLTTALESVNASRSDHVGGLVGNNHGTISHGYSNLNILGGGYNNIGGLVGGNHGMVSNSYAVGTVAGTVAISIGGLTGTNSGVIESSYAYGDIFIRTVSSDHVRSYPGKLSGNNDDNSTITTSYYHRDASITDGQSNALEPDTYAMLGVGLSTEQLHSGTGTMLVGFESESWNFRDGWLPSIIGTDGTELPGQPFDDMTIARVNMLRHIKQVIRNQPTGAPGTANNPYTIGGAAELQSIATGFTSDQTNNIPIGLSESLNAHYRLTADIDLSSIVNFVPIGNGNAPFNGTFDGRLYEIGGLRIERSNAEVGLFGRTDGTIRNVILTRVFVCGLADNATIGALAGYIGGSQEATPRGSVAFSAVVGGTVCGNRAPRQEVGGLAGYNGGTIRNSYATVNVDGGVSDRRGNGQYDRVGGLVGNNDDQGQIENVYATGRITAGIQSQSGGVIGKNSGSISSSYATGDVNADVSSGIGALIGVNTGRFPSTYYTDEASVAIGPANTHGQSLSVATLRSGTISNTPGLGINWQFSNGNMPLILGDDGTLLPGQPGNLLSTAPTVYLITTATELQSIASGFSNSQTGNRPLALRYSRYAHYRLAKHINLSGIGNFTPIGTPEQPFRGTFDGANHTLSNLSIIDNAGRDSVGGLFGYLYQATIQNVTLRNPSVSGDRHVGALVGRAGLGTTITNSKTIGGGTVEIAIGGAVQLTGTVGDVGGLIGYNAGTVTDSSAGMGRANIVRVQNHSTTLSPNSPDNIYGVNIGGLIGYNVGIVRDSEANSTVSVDNNANANNVGGLVGRHESGNRLPTLATISNSTVIATVRGGSGHCEFLGGLVGYNIDGAIRDSQATVTMNGGAGQRDQIGGLIGLNTIDPNNKHNATLHNNTVDSRGGVRNRIGAEYSVDDYPAHVGYTIFDTFVCDPWRGIYIIQDRMCFSRPGNVCEN